MTNILLAGLLAIKPDFIQGQEGKEATTEAADRGG